MKRKSKLRAIIFLLIALIAITGYLVIGNPLVPINNQKLVNSINSINSDVVQINEIVPFDWDIVYTFEPYSSKESIEEIVGFKSADIKANNINEGMVHLLFVKGRKVVASVLGYSANLGYHINFSSKITFSENAKFNVTIADEIITLSYQK